MMYIKQFDTSGGPKLNDDINRIDKVELLVIFEIHLD